MVRRSLLGCLVLLAALPASATGAELGGGAIFGPPTAVDRGVGEEIFFKAPRSLPGRMNVAIDVDNLRCAEPAFGVPANTPVTNGINRFPRVRVARDGTFSASAVIDETNAEGGRNRGRSTLKGTLRGASASGTISAFIKVTDASGAPQTRCELAPKRWFAKSATRVSRERVRRPDGRRYFGVNNGIRSETTKSRLPAIVNLTRSRRRGAIVMNYNARCTQDPSQPIFGSADFSPIFRVRAGKFAVGETYNSGDPAGPGFAARITTRYTGAFVRRGVKGTFRIRATLFQDGTEIDRCDTGRVRWRALRP